MKKFLFLLAVCLPVLFVACDDDEAPNDTNAIVTDKSEEVTAVGARAFGHVDFNKLENVSEFGIAYSPDSKFSTTSFVFYDPKGKVEGMQNFSVRLTLLKPNTTYYYRAYVRTDKGKELVGNTLSFTTDQYPRMPYVDLGLDSHTLWATCNVGAKSPEEFGSYFQWGDVVGYPQDNRDGKIFDEAHCKWYNTIQKTFTKYNKTDQKTMLDLEDDAAYMNWGPGWQTPTEDQFIELFDESVNSISYTTYNNVQGIEIKSKKNGNKIFLPAAGWFYKGTEFSHGGMATMDGSGGPGGHYWTREVGGDVVARDFGYDFIEGIHATSLDARYRGLTVRPVRQQQ